MIESGKIDKLTFTAFTDVKFKNKLKEEPYSVMINPESFKRGMSISYKSEQAKGSTASAGKFDKMKPEKYSFEFIVDGTGVIAGSNKANTNPKEDVTANIEHFLKVVYNYISSAHRPPFVEIEYCELIMRCVLDSLDISYTMFHPDSRPLRAKISCSFTSVMSPEIEAKKKDDQSPDITHKRVMKEGESLIELANNIYESNIYYIDVAEKNQLNTFRRIKPGTEIYFPPLKNNF